jgi:hypothetical protein
MIRNVSPAKDVAPGKNGSGQPQQATAPVHANLIDRHLSRSPARCHPCPLRRNCRPSTVLALRKNGTSAHNYRQALVVEESAEFTNGESRPLVQAARLMVAGLHPNLRPHSRTYSVTRCR